MKKWFSKIIPKKPLLIFFVFVIYYFFVMIDAKPYIFFIAGGVTSQVAWVLWKDLSKNKKKKQVNNFEEWDV